MYRLLFLIASQLFAAIAVAQTSDQIVNMTIYSDPPGATIWVDEKHYTDRATFLWPVGSKHVLRIDAVQNSNVLGRRFTFSGWTDGSGTLQVPSLVLPITASPNISVIKAMVTLEYELKVNFFDCPAAGSCGNSPGTVMVNGAPFQSSKVAYYAPESQLNLVALPNPGFVFTGWSGPVTPQDSFSTSTVIRGPMTVSARFAPARKVKFVTDPPELEILLDRQLIRTPVEMDLGAGTQHLLAAPAWQTDLTSGLWVLDSFSTGGGVNSTFTVGESNVAQTITAKFVKGARTSFVTVPSNLKLRIDGRENWPGYNFVWAAGSKHTVTAVEQTDSRGNRYVFKEWSNGGAATQEVVADPGTADEGMRLIATFDHLSRLMVQSIPNGLNLQIDGAECRTPCAIEKLSGTEARVVAPASLGVNENSRLDFEGWTDGGAASRAVRFGETGTLTARYRTSHRLAAASEPEGGAVVRGEPGSGDGFYAEGSQVAIIADSKPGFEFRRWEGDASGISRTTMVEMRSPRQVTAVLERKPFLAQSAVRNAAAELPEPGVSAGSLVSVVGASLSLVTQAGPQSPLAQTLAGVTVRVDNRLLPLMFVSPEQINAVLPADLGEGEYGVTVRVTGLPDISGRFNVVRNAPGLFGYAIDGLTFASAMHQDGSQITIESPARRDEIITLLGTGFGPYKNRPPDGFPVPEGYNYELADLVDVVIGDSVVQPVWAGAATGMVGTTAVRVRIGDAFPAGSTVELRARTGGRDSNSVRLPIE